MANTLEEHSPADPSGERREFKKVEIFRLTCNLDTVRDGRGGIFYLGAAGTDCRV